MTITSCPQTFVYGCISKALHYLIVDFKLFDLTFVSKGDWAEITLQM